MAIIRWWVVVYLLPLNSYSTLLNAVYCRVITWWFKSFSHCHHYFLVGLRSRTVELKEFGNNTDVSLKHTHKFTQTIIQIVSYLRVHMYIFTRAYSIYYMYIYISPLFYLTWKGNAFLVLRFKVLPQKIIQTFKGVGHFHHCTEDLARRRSNCGLQASDKKNVASKSFGVRIEASHGYLLVLFCSSPKNHWNPTP